MSRSMRTKLLGILALSVMATVMVGWLGIAGMKNLNTAFTALYVNDFQPARVIAEADIAIMIWNRDMLNYVLARDPEVRDGDRRAVFEQKEVVLARLRHLSAMKGLTTEEKLLVSAIADHFREAESRWDPVLAPVTDGEQSAAEPAEALLVVLKPLIQQINAEMSAFLHLQELDSQTAQTTADQRFHTTSRAFPFSSGSSSASCSMEIVAGKLSMMRVFRNLAANALKYGGERLREISIGYEQTFRSFPSFGLGT